MAVTFSLQLGGRTLYLASSFFIPFFFLFPPDRITNHSFASLALCSNEGVMFKKFARHLAYPQAFPTWFFPNLSTALSSDALQLLNKHARKTGWQTMSTSSVTYINSTQARYAFYRICLRFNVPLALIFLYLTAERLLEPLGLNIKQLGDGYSRERRGAHCCRGST